MFSGNTSKFGELTTTTDIGKARLVTVPNKDIKISPTPDFTPDNSHLVGVTSENKGILIPASEMIPGIAFNSEDGNPRPMVSDVIWNEQEQLREAFTEGDAFTLPHFRYVADDYFWKSIVGDKCFYYLTSMDLVTWPLAWTPGSTNPALHLEWLRAPDQTQIFKFTDATHNSTWTAPVEYGAIILQNRTREMVSQDPMDVRVNECSTSTKLKEVRVVVKSKDASPLYVNFPGADVSLTIPQIADTAVTPNVTSTLANVKLTSDTAVDEDAICAWRTFTLNTQATVLSNCFNVEGDNFCSSTVYVNAPSIETLDIKSVGSEMEQNCFRGAYIPGAGIPDVRVALPAINQAVTFFENFPLQKETILYLLRNINSNTSEQQMLTIGIDTKLGVVNESGFWSLSDSEIIAEVTRLDSSGKWYINWKPVFVGGGSPTGVLRTFVMPDMLTDTTWANTDATVKATTTYASTFSSTLNLGYVAIDRRVITFDRPVEINRVTFNGGNGTGLFADSSRLLKKLELKVDGTLVATFDNLNTAETRNFIFDKDILPVIGRQFEVIPYGVNLVPRLGRVKFYGYQFY